MCVAFSPSQLQALKPVEFKTGIETSHLRRDIKMPQVTSHYSTQTVAKTLAYRTLSSWRYVLYPLYGLWINSNSDGKKKHLAVYQKHKIVYVGFDLAENNSFKTGASEESVNGLPFNEL